MNSSYTLVFKCSKQLLSLSYGDYGVTTQQNCGNLESTLIVAKIHFQLLG